MFGPEKKRLAICTAHVLPVCLFVRYTDSFLSSIDVKDSTGWLEATVIKADDFKICVRFNGWPTTWQVCCMLGLPTALRRLYFSPISSSRAPLQEHVVQARI